MRRKNGRCLWRHFSRIGIHEYRSIIKNNIIPLCMYFILPGDTFLTNIFAATYKRLVAVYSDIAILLRIFLCTISTN